MSNAYSSFQLQCRQAGRQSEGRTDRRTDIQHFLNLRAKWQRTESDKIQSVTFSYEILSSVFISSSSAVTEWAPKALHHSLFSCFLRPNATPSFHSVCFREGSSFFWGLTFTVPHFLCSSPSCTSISILNLSSISQHLTPSTPPFLSCYHLTFFSHPSSSGRISDRKGLHGGANVGSSPPDKPHLSTHHNFHTWQWQMLRE